MTIERAAEVFGVSPRTVDNARKVEQKGSPKLKERFRAGDVAVSTAAEIAKAPAPVQEAIAALPPETIKVAALFTRGPARIGTLAFGFRR